MFYKLAFRNVTKSLRDYAVYFLTLMFGVCLFYMFNSLDAQTVMLKVSQSQKEILRSLARVIGYVSVFISVILGFLVVYANGFLMRRRKKELGVYMTLGMPRGRISAILVLETLLIGAVSLAAGLAAGIFLSQGMSVVTARMFEANLEKFVFTFSQSAFWKTLVYFGVIFVVVMAFNIVSVSRLKLIDLLGAGRRNQKLRIRRLWISVVLFLVSVGCLAEAYRLILTNGMFRITPQFVASLVLGSAGTLLFFFSLSGFLLRTVQADKKLYFKNLNMFVLRQFNSKINTTFVSVSVICIMLLVTIGTLSTGVTVSRVLSADLKTACPYDATLISWGGSGEKTDESGKIVKTVSIPSKDILASLKKSGFDLSRWSDRYAQVSLYEEKEISYALFFNRDNWPKIFGEYDPAQAQGMRISLMSLSDFNRLRTLRGEKPLALAEDRYAVNCTYASVAPAYDDALRAGKKITIGGKALTPLKTRLAESYADSGTGADGGTLILPDAFLDGKTPFTTILNLNFNPGAENDEFGKALAAVKGSDADPNYHYLTTKKDIYELAGGSKMMASYLALYIGLVFLIAAAAVLALQQLSEAADNVERYGLLRKLGAEEKMVDHALFTQIALYFLLPLSLAAVHSAVGIQAVNQALVTADGVDMLWNIFATAAIFLVVYGAYFLATYFGSRSMIRSAG